MEMANSPSLRCLVVSNRVQKRTRKLSISQHDLCLCERGGKEAKTELTWLLRHMLNLASDFQFEAPKNKRERRKLCH